MKVLDRFDLSGQTAVVTGSTRGLGRAFAQALSEAGANVVVVGRSASEAEAVSSELTDQGARSIGVAADVTSRKDIERLLERTAAEFDRADILVNNAGVCIHKAAVDVTDEEWRHVMDVNVDGLWITSQVFGRHMISRGGGSIINVGSMSAAIVNRPQWQPAYNASKAAVHHLTRSLAAEWAPHNVRVNALAPGYMRTDMSPIDDPQFHRYWIEDTPQQRAGEPEELGGAIVFLASAASSFMTGSVLTVDGGYSVF
ncbi:SDR family NAD(P)-dependent oxidoreductase [Sinomonas susongensis]|uniref:SDR family NAD(P)-dependent oxidoreductase n=1 Tax=Sinomonas susongensis TaxID=1324851 RepID=UPI0011092857|nr:glucose 1-dehydrogenase [Sinomonas susongensis]